MSNRRRWLKDAWHELAEACGFRREGVVGGSPSGIRLAVTLSLPGGQRQIVGYLSRESGEYVFSYDPSFARSGQLPPIPEFPSVNDVYRSERLWAFFEARIPPPDRQDIKAILDRSATGTSSADVLSILGQVSRKTVASPYDLEVAAASGAR